MDFLWILLTIVAELGVLFLFLLLAWSTYYYLTTAEVPHGLCEASKMKYIYFLSVLIFSLDYVIWKIGLCNKYHFVNFLLDRFPPFKDADLSIKSLHIEAVPVRLYQPKAAQTVKKGFLFIHGGAGTLGTIDIYERFCRYISKESDSVVLSLGYTLSPEQPYPVQFQECLDVAIHFMKHAEDYGVDPDRIIISGDSFGGLLAASVCQMIAQRDDVPKLCSQMLIYPFLQVVKYSLPSYMQNAYAPPLTRRQAVKFALQYMQIDRGFEDLFLEGLLIPSDMKMKYRKLLSADNIPEEFKVRETKARKYTAPFADMQELIDHLYGPLLSPLLVEDAIIRQLPQTFILTGQYDVLRDDGILYKKRLEDNDVPVSWHHFEDGFHGSLFYINHWIANFSCCEEGMDSIVNYIRGL